jgi:hypothetical protein
MLAHCQRLFSLLTHSSNLFVDLGISLLEHSDLLRQLLVLNSHLLNFLTLVRVNNVGGAALRRFVVLGSFQLQGKLMVLLLKIIYLLQKDYVLLHDLLVRLLERLLRLD